jgi:hypothetical protein
MSDLSRMLDDLYAVPEGDDDPVDETPTRAPAWSSEEALDEVFDSWVPGANEDAPAREWSLVGAASGEVAVAPSAELDTWRQETEPVAEAPVVVGPARWSPSDDDILPARRRGRRSVRP